MHDDLDPELTTSLEADGARCVLRVKGEIDLFTADAFQAALAAAGEAADQVLVDLTRVSFIDSSGLRALLELRLRLQPRDGAVTLAVADDGPVARLLDLAGVDDLFSREPADLEKG